MHFIAVLQSTGNFKAEIRIQKEEWIDLGKGRREISLGFKP